MEEALAQNHRDKITDAVKVMKNHPGLPYTMYARRINLHLCLLNYGCYAYKEIFLIKVRPNYKLKKM